MTLHEGDCLQVMKTMPDNSIDFVCCDPPYALTGKSGNGGFMGKEWDNEIPGVNCWKELLRIVKPGSLIACFGGSRTHHHLMLNLEQAGWEIRDVMFWLYASGFPKSLDIGKHVPSFDGYKTCLKPAYEPIILCMKPLDGTYAQNALKWNVAGLNVDASRIPINDEVNFDSKQNHLTMGYGGSNNPKEFNHYKKSGRYPSNVILDESSAELLDQQSGFSKTPLVGKRKGKRHNADGWGHGNQEGEFPCYGDSGGASRFFKVFPNEESLRFKYCPKASSSERQGSTHPTMKPLALMRYIIKLLAPPGNPVCLDPFCGSGTTMLACKELGIDCIGIEREAEYCEIIRKRLSIT